MNGGRYPRGGRASPFQGSGRFPAGGRYLTRGGGSSHGGGRFPNGGGPMQMRHHPPVLHLGGRGRGRGGLTVAAAGAQGHVFSSAPGAPLPHLSGAAGNIARGGRGVHQAGAFHHLIPHPASVGGRRIPPPGGSTLPYSGGGFGGGGGREMPGRPSMHGAGRGDRGRGRGVQVPQQAMAVGGRHHRPLMRGGPPPPPPPPGMRGITGTTVPPPPPKLMQQVAVQLQTNLPNAQQQQGQQQIMAAAGVRGALPPSHMIVAGSAAPPHSMSGNTLGGRGNANAIIPQQQPAVQSSFPPPPFTSQQHTTAHQIQHQSLHTQLTIQQNVRGLQHSPSPTPKNPLHQQHQQRQVIGSMQQQIPNHHRSHNQMTTGIGSSNMIVGTARTAQLSNNVGSVSVAAANLSTAVLNSHSSRTMNNAPNDVNASAAANNNQEKGSAAALFTKEQIDQAWSEHTAPSGMKYYYNSATKQSTYNKPVQLVSAISDNASNSHQRKSDKKVKDVSSKAKNWTEYIDANTGNTYYSDGATTTWEVPEGFEDTSGNNNNKTIKQEVSSSPNSEPLRKKRKAAGSIMSENKESKFNNNEEAISAFKGLLLAKGISPTLKWNEVIKMCSSDSRWDDCEQVLTTGERKQALAEYQTKRANELRVLERQERARAKDSFVQLLSETLISSSSSTSNNSNLKKFNLWNSRFMDIRDIVSKDDRFYSVQDEGTRESLFLDFCEELRKREERKKRNKKREAQEAFISFLKEMEEACVLSFASTWSSFISSLKDGDRADARLAISSTITDSDRQLYFADFVIELQAVEDDKRRRIRNARRWAEKAQREVYRETLQRLVSDGNLSIYSRWRNVEEIISAEDSFPPVQEQDRDAPREFFEEFMDEWNDRYRRDRLLLIQLVNHPTSNREILVKSDTSYDEFVKALLEEASISSSQQYGMVRRIINREEPVSSARLYFNELLLRAKENESTNAVSSRKKRRGVLFHNDSSSEDEGEIIEDGEVSGTMG